MIEYINVSRIAPHPDNPRKDLGDLTELVESIKSNGILQNLTVVKGLTEGLYTVVIGHRRLAAALLAGLREVPCVISDMGQKQQVATMLLENMQRSDLTIYEQAQGFQMMLDFGETIAEISKQTGFSDSTIRRRVKLMELDQDKLRKSIERGATLMDYAELDKIKDPELKDKVLDTIGTSNFRYELQRTIDNERAKEYKAKLIEQLEQFAAQVESGHNLRYVKGYYPSQESEIEVPDDAETGEYFYVVSNYGINLYAKHDLEPDEDETAEAEMREMQRACRAALDEVKARAYKLRGDFVRGISNFTAAKNIGTVIQYSLRGLLEFYSGSGIDDFVEFLGGEIGINEGDEFEFEDIIDFIKKQPERCLLVAAYLNLDSERDSYYSWEGNHRDNKSLDTVYAFLAELGYQMSSEEQALKDGTHELFAE